MNFVCIKTGIYRCKKMKIAFILKHNAVIEFVLIIYKYLGPKKLEAFLRQRVMEHFQERQRNQDAGKLHW